jgi:hypothetical protein
MITQVSGLYVPLRFQILNAGGLAAKASTCHTKLVHKDNRTCFLK